MKASLRNFLLHLILFVVVEVAFVFIIFRERPSTNLLTTIGIGHLTYWVLLIGAGIRRSRTDIVWQRFLATYSPIVFHLFMHLYVGMETLHAHVADTHHQQESRRIILGVIGFGLLIYRGELLLHRKYHCDMHHADTHKYCHDHDCEKPHTS